MLRFSNDSMARRTALSATATVSVAAACWLDSTDHSVRQRATSKTSVGSKKSKIGEKGLTVRKWASCDSIPRTACAARTMTLAAIDARVLGVVGFAV